MARRCFPAVANVLLLLLIPSFLRLSLAQSASTSTTEQTAVANTLTELPTNSRASYDSYASTLTLSQSSTILANATTGASSSSSVPSRSSSSGLASSSGTRTTLVGTASATATSTASVECNGYSDFCDRKYSNITYVVAHNSPFTVAHNAASNQVYDVTTQLDNGIRGLQSEVHYVNDTLYLCHTSCSELNAGILEAYLVTVKDWLDENRYEVITILLGNEDYVDAGNYTAPVTNSGLLDYVYIPDTVPMNIDGWPTLGDMILANKRVVMMVEYDANQTEVPWLLDMWAYQWQTPFSPTNESFPCTVQRPPGQSREVSEERLYLINHNLNAELSLAALDLDILIPDTANINNTNANTTGTGTAQTNVDTCVSEWGRNPNYLLVDYYNDGNFEGSTLAVAAKANNVSYNVDSCCGNGTTTTSDAERVHLSALLVGGISIAVLFAL